MYYSLDLITGDAELAFSPRGSGEGFQVTAHGWVRTSRFSKRITFLHIYDGSIRSRFDEDWQDTVQIVIDPAVPPELKQKLVVGAAVKVSGTVVKSKGAEQLFEIKCSPEDIEIIGECDASEYPVQKKEAGKEFYRTIPHLRTRTKEFQRIFSGRNRLARLIHNFFYGRGFHWVHTPIITASDCEGAGEMFVLKDEEFFGKETFLTVSGQLEVEPFACAFSQVYTFGPTFRAENSNTSRHASEFWMIEPEIAFATVDDVMDLAEDFVKHIASWMSQHDKVGEGSFPRVSYTEAQEILVKAVEEGHEFEYPVGWGEALQAEHERYLTEQVYERPIFVTDYPIEQKAFYMRVNDDQKTVACFDLLVPGVGEIIGGSAREERMDKLLEQMERFDMDAEHYSWYVDLRRYGSVPHGGFGLGFERALMWLLDIENIRDAIPYPRTPKQLT